jgi:hypothetical protein
MGAYYLCSTWPGSGSWALWGSGEGDVWFLFHNLIHEKYFDSWKSSKCFENMTWLHVKLGLNPSIATSAILRTWTSYITYLSLSFPISKISMTRPPSRVVKITWEDECKIPGECQVVGKRSVPGHSRVTMHGQFYSTVTVYPFSRIYLTFKIQFKCHYSNDIFPGCPSCVSPCILGVCLCPGPAMLELCVITLSLH